MVDNRDIFVCTSIQSAFDCWLLAPLSIPGHMFAFPSQLFDDKNYCSIISPSVDEVLRTGKPGERMPRTTMKRVLFRSIASSLSHSFFDTSIRRRSNSRKITKLICDLAEKGSFFPFRGLHYHHRIFYPTGLTSLWIATHHRQDRLAEAQAKGRKINFLGFNL